jgi:hypothetical protein
MPTFPSIDESRDRLHRAGWSVGEIATATRWVVYGNSKGMVESLSASAGGRHAGAGMARSQGAREHRY